MKDRQDDRLPGDPVLSGRDLLRGAAFGGVALFLAACGGLAAWRGRSPTTAST